jgi:hypothetical protein
MSQKGIKLFLDVRFKLSSDMGQKAVVTDKLILISAAFQERIFISEKIFL